MHSATATAFLLSILCACAGRRILLLCPDHTGHCGAMLELGKALLHAGHEVHALALERYQKQVELAGVHPILVTGLTSMYDMKEVIDPVDEILLQGDGKFTLSFFLKSLKLANIPARHVIDQVRYMVHQDKLMRQLQDMKFDLAVVDGFPLIRPMYLIPYRLNIPYVTFAKSMDRWLARVPSLPSIETYGILPVDNQMSFLQRTINLIFHIFFSMDLLYPTVDEELIEECTKHRERKTLREIAQDSEFFLLNVDTILLDYPRAEMPHLKHIGVMGGRPAKPLPAHLEHYVSQATDGIVVVSFGSMFNNIPMRIVENLLTAFSKFPQKFIMGFQPTLDQQKIPEYVKILKWLPQNDLLGHNNTRLFISHCGLFGQIEGFYHGVPMLMAPFGMDQPYNAKRAEHHGLGRTINLRTATPGEIEELIRELLTNPSYANKAKRYKEIRQSLPDPGKIAVFWIEHVMKHGSAHLKPPFMDMPLYQFFMLDNLIVIAVIIKLFLIGSFFSCRACLRLIGRKKKKSKQD